jgi:diaminopimelate decarboxylase
LRAGVATPRFSDKDLYSLAEKYGTPYFLIDEATLRRKVSEMEQGFAEFKGVFRVAYSVKANFNPSVIKTFMTEGILFDLTAPGELEFVVRSGGSVENVLYTSIIETQSEDEQVLRQGVRRVVVAGYGGLSNLVAAAEKENVFVKTMMSVNPEVHVHAEFRGSMGHGKFDLQVNGGNHDNAFHVLKRALNTPAVIFEGFHFHLGSQIEDPSCYAEAIEKLEAFILDAKRQLGQFPVTTIDIGGGLPAPNGKKVLSPKDLGAKIVGQLNNLVESLGEGSHWRPRAEGSSRPSPHSWWQGSSTSRTSETASTSTWTQGTTRSLIPLCCATNTRSKSSPGAGSPPRRWSWRAGFVTP